MTTLRAHFRPEFLNRIDEIIIFEALTKEQLRSIVRLQLDQVARMAKSQDVELAFDDSIVEQLALEGYRPEFGARELRRRIRQVIENPLARELLDGRIKEGNRIVCRFDALQDDAVFELGSTALDTGAAAATPADDETATIDENGSDGKTARKRHTRARKSNGGKDPATAAP